MYPRWRHLRDESRRSRTQQNPDRRVLSRVPVIERSLVNVRLLIFSFIDTLRAPCTRRRVTRTTRCDYRIHPIHHGDDSAEQQRIRATFSTKTFWRAIPHSNRITPIDKKFRPRNNRLRADDRIVRGIILSQRPGRTRKPRARDVLRLFNETWLPSNRQPRGRVFLHTTNNNNECRRRNILTPGTQLVF